MIAPDNAIAGVSEAFYAKTAAAYALKVPMSRKSISAAA